MLMLIGGLIVAYFVYVLISRKNDRVSDPPAMAHAALRDIIERAAEEARKLPGLSASADTEYPREGRPIAEHSYEDLLATAILNKVIERCQREQRVDGNSNVLRDTDSPKAKCITTEYSLEEEATSYASRRHECSGDRGASAIGENDDDCEPMSFMMEERIEEVTTIMSTNNELHGNNALEFGCTRRVAFPEFGMDIVDPPRDSPSPSPSSSSESSDDYPRIRTRRHVADHTTDLVSSIESWEDNWLFQRKKASGSQTDPVAMLVPSSNADYKALIGDKDAEDTSDLSECSSTRSDEEIEKELLEAINNVVPKSPRISECNAEMYQEVPSIKTQLEKDKVTACRTNIEKIEIVCEKRKKDGEDKSLEISEEKTVKDEENERKRSKGSSLITVVTEEKTKEKDTEGDRGTIAIESSVNDVKVEPRKLSKKNEQTGNVTDENEEQRESEYTEHYDMAIQRHLDSLTKVDVCSGESETSDEARKLADTQYGEPDNKENNSIVEQKSERSEAKVQVSYTALGENHTTAENDRLSAPPRPGTIAEREHKKWENAPPIENNPYSEESIRKRCLERQYSRNSDILGAHYELTRLNEVNLDALLVLDRSDIKRFGRDYYINQSKSASGERQERARSAMSSVSSRPSSSLSQRSSCCTGDEQQREQQDDSTSNETDAVSVPRKNKDTASWRRNNTEMISPDTNNRATADLQRDKNEKVETTTWKNHRQQTDDILEDQRKNSKNEINAKLNNQEHILEAERKNDKERKIRRIDLKAYGFENEFSDSQREKAARQQRVVNRLDLSSYGYENGVLRRRARSNIQLNRPLQNEKSNLTRWAIERRGEYKGHSIDALKSFDRKEFANRIKDLNELRNGHVGSRLMSAKSMPNVADDVYYKTSLVHENRGKLVAGNLTDRAIDRSEDGMMDECSITDDNCSLLNSCDEISSDVDESFEDIYAKNKDQSQGQVSEELKRLSSVKRLAQVFCRRQTSQIETAAPAKVNRISAAKTDDARKERSSTLEVQVVETPRQMHSLTARSLSKEFREGLRQMPGKVTSPPVSRSAIEERSANRAEVVRSKKEDNDTAVISPGKLKSNIIFWEQMQKRS